MHIIIVGAGIAGLSLALALTKSNHTITILESAPQLAEIGAGIQMTPQAVKYFFQWGLKDDIMKECIVPEKIFIRDYRAGETIGAIDMTVMERLYGAPYIVVHRAVLHAILHRHVVRAGAEIRLDCRVVEYDFEDGVVVLKSGERLQADLVVAADGINSFARSQLLKDSDPGSQPTGWAALRMMAEVSKIKADPATEELVNLETNSSVFWIAPDRSCMTYLIKDASMLNIVLSHRDDIDMTKLTYEEHKDIVQKLFDSFEPRVRHLLDLSLPKIVNYPVYAVPPLPNWIHPSGRFTLLGDAAHAMAFYLSMGVSLAVEDAASLATVLNLACSHPITPNASELQKAMSVFEDVRKSRAESVQRASLRAGDSFHIVDGQEREAMYELMRHTNEDFDVSPDTLETAMDGQLEYDTARAIGGLANKKTRDWCYGYDAIANVSRCFRSRSD